MDNFNVPKKVNRHVLKALNILSSGNCKEAITLARICHQVRFQMRNLVPVPNLEYAVQKSLKNLSEVGVIERQGSMRYCLGRNYAPPSFLPQPGRNPNQPQPDRRIFKVIDNKRKNRTTLDPNLKRTCCNSDDSLSGDDIDKTRKRMRSNNKKLRHSGRTAVLPRARQHKVAPMKMCDVQPNFVTDKNDSSDNSIEHVIKTSAAEFAQQHDSPGPSSDITDISEEAIKKGSEVEELPVKEKIVDMMLDPPKLETCSSVRNKISRTSTSHLVEIPSTSKVDDEVRASGSQVSSHRPKESPTGRLDLTYSYIN